ANPGTQRGGRRCRHGTKSVRSFGECHTRKTTRNRDSSSNAMSERDSTVGGRGDFQSKGESTTGSWPCVAWRISRTPVGVVPCESHGSMARGKEFKTTVRSLRDTTTARRLGPRWNILPTAHRRTGGPKFLRFTRRRRTRLKHWSSYT